MSRLAFILFVAVLITHYGYDPIATLWPEPARAAPGLFYVLRGFEGALLFAVVMAWPRASLDLLLVCAWGFLEETQTSVCMLALGIADRPPLEQWRGLCDFLTGWPIYALTLAVVAWVVTSRTR